MGNAHFEGSPFDTDNQALGPVIGVIGTDGNVYSLKVDPVTGELLVQSSGSAGAATEAKQDDIISELQDIEVDVEATVTALGTLLTEATFSAEDFATETTLAAAKAVLDALEAKDFATQTTLAALLTELEAKADVTENQPVLVPGSRLNTGSSSTTALTSSQDVVGPWVDTQNLGSLLFFAFGLAPLTTFQLEWSSDGATQDTDLLSTTDGIDSEEVTQGFYVYLTSVTTMVRRYVRVHVTNDTTAQTAGSYAHALWTYGTGSYPWTFLHLNDELSNLSQGLLTRAVVAGPPPDGGFSNQGVAGTLTLTPTPSALGSAATYNSDIFSFDQMAIIRLAVATDQVSAANGVKIKWWSDAVGTRQVGEVTYTFLAADATAGFGDFPSAMMRSAHFSVHMTNGTAAQGFLDIVCRLIPYPTVRDTNVVSLSRGSNIRLETTGTGTNTFTFGDVGPRATVSFKADPVNQSGRYVHVGFNSDGSQDWPLAPGEDIHIDIAEGTTMYWHGTHSALGLYVMQVGDPRT